MATKATKKHKFRLLRCIICELRHIRELLERQPHRHDGGHHQGHCHHNGEQYSGPDGFGY